MKNTQTRLIKKNSIELLTRFANNFVARDYFIKQAQNYCSTSSYVTVGLDVKKPKEHVFYLMADVAPGQTAPTHSLYERME